VRPVAALPAWPVRASEQQAVAGRAAGVPAGAVRAAAARPGAPGAGWGRALRGGR
jgi:hypothetical protein